MLLFRAGYVYRYVSLVGSAPTILQPPVSRAIALMYETSLWRPGGIYTDEKYIDMFQRGEFPDLPLPNRRQDAVVKAIAAHLDLCDLGEETDTLFWIIAARNMVHVVLHFPEALCATETNKALLYRLMETYTSISESDIAPIQCNRAISTVMGALSELSEDTLTQLARGANDENMFNQVLSTLFDAFATEERGNSSGVPLSHGLLKSAYVIGAKLDWKWGKAGPEYCDRSDFKALAETQLTTIYTKELSTSYIPKVSSDTMDHSYINEGFFTLVSQDLAVFKYSVSHESTIDLRDMDTHTRLAITELTCTSKETVTHELVQQESNPSLGVIKVTSRKQAIMSRTQKAEMSSETVRAEHRQYTKISSHLYSLDTSEVTTTQKNSGTEVNAENATQASLREGENTQERKQDTDQQAFETGTQFRLSSTDTEKNAVDLDREIRDTNAKRTENRSDKAFLWDKNKSTIDSVTDVENNTTQNKETKNSKVSAGFIPSLFVSGGTDTTKEKTSSKSHEKQKQKSEETSDREQKSTSSGETDESTNEHMEGTHNRAHTSRQTEASRVNDANERMSGSHSGRREDGKDTSREASHAETVRSGQKTNTQFVEGGQTSTKGSLRDEDQERDETRSDSQQRERRHMEEVRQAQQTIERVQEYTIDAGSTVFVFEKQETTVFKSDLKIESIQDLSHFSYDGRTLSSLDQLPCPTSGGLAEMIWRKLRNPKNRTFIARRHDVEHVQRSEPAEVKLMIRTSEAVKDEFQIFAKYYAYFQQFIERKFNKPLTFDQRKQIINLRWELLSQLSAKNEPLTFYLLEQFDRVFNDLNIETVMERQVRTNYFQKFVKTAMPSHGSGAVLSPSETGFLIGRQNLSPSDSCRHLIVLGPTGSGKTTRFFLPNLIAPKGCSVIVNDIKGTLYRDTAASMREKGYKIIVINFNENAAEGSDVAGYNPFDLLEASKHDPGKKFKYLEQILDALDQPSESAGKGQEGANWAVSWAKQVIRAAVELMLLSDQPMTFSGIASLIFRSDMTGIPDSSDTVVELKKIILDIREKNQNTTTVMSRIRDMLDPLAKDPSVERMTRQQRHIENQTVFKDLRKQKTVVYLISDQSRLKLCAPLLGLFYSQFFSSVVADTRPNSLQVYCHLDEAGHVKVPDLATHMTTVRELKIAIAIGLQDLSQLEKLYGESRSKEIMNGGVGSWLIFPSSGYSKGIVELVSRASGGALSTTDITNRAGLTDDTVTFMHSGCAPIKINLPPNDNRDNAVVPVSVTNKVSLEYEKDLIQKAFRDFKFGRGKSQLEITRALVQQLKNLSDNSGETKESDGPFDEKAKDMLSVVFGISRTVNPDAFTTDTCYDPFLETLCCMDPGIEQLEGFFDFVYHRNHSYEDMMMLPDVRHAMFVSDLFLDFVRLKNGFKTNVQRVDKGDFHQHFGFRLEKWALFSSRYFDSHCLRADLNVEVDEEINRVTRFLKNSADVPDPVLKRYTTLVALRYPHMQTLAETLRILDKEDGFSAEQSIKNTIKLYASFGYKVPLKKILGDHKGLLATLKKKYPHVDVTVRGWIEDVWSLEQTDPIGFLEEQVKRYPTVKRLEMYLNHLQQEGWSKEDMLDSDELIQLLFTNEVSADLIKISVLKDMFYGDNNNPNNAVEVISLDTLASWIEAEQNPEYRVDPQFGFQNPDWAALMLRVFFEKKTILMSQVLEEPLQVLEEPLCVNASVIAFLQNIINRYLDHGDLRLQAIKIYPVSVYFLQLPSDMCITQDKWRQFLDHLSRDSQVPRRHRESASQINDLKPSLSVESEVPEHY